MSVEEVSGRTVDDAVERALARLGVARDRVDVEVIREGKRGLLGFGGEDAIVRVTTKDDHPAPGRGQRGGRGGRGGGRGGRGGGRGGQRGDSAPREDRGGRRDDGARGDERGDEHDEGPPREDRGGGRRGRRGGRGGRGRRRGGDRGRERGGGPREHDRERVPFEGELPPVPGVPDNLPLAPTADAEDEIDFAGSTLRELLTLLGLMDTRIEAREPETPGDGVGRTAQVFEITGETEDASDELGLLIGRRGETLGALQYLLNVITRQHYGEANHVFAVDVEGYKSRRERSLVEMARRVAAEVRDTGDVITLEPMKPAERRIVHLALSEEPGVVTESVGSGNDRQVEVLPVDFEEYDEAYEDDYDDYDEGPDRAAADDVADDEPGEPYDDEDVADDERDDEPYDDEDVADDEPGDEPYDDEDVADDEPYDDEDVADDEDDEGPNR